MMDTRQREHLAAHAARRAVEHAKRCDQETKTLRKASRDAQATYEEHVRRIWKREYAGALSVLEDDDDEA